MELKKVNGFLSKVIDNLNAGGLERELSLDW